MNLGIPSCNLDLLQSLSGRKIIQVNRQLFKDDFVRNDFEQTADGPIEIMLDDGNILNFYSLLEIESIGVKKGLMEKYGDSYEYRNLTKNSFWKPRIGRIIKKIFFLKSKYASDNNPSEFAIKIQLENNLEIYFEYLNEEDFLDTLRITEKYLVLIALLKKYEQNNRGIALL